MMTDPIADMLTRIRNALRVRKDKVRIPRSKIKLAIADALKREGYIDGFREIGEGIDQEIEVDLKYGPDGEEVISSITRASRPGLRMYRGTQELKPVLNGLGISVISTSQGILSDRECRERKIGGELLCSVW